MNKRKFWTESKKFTIVVLILTLFFSPFYNSFVLEILRPKPNFKILCNESRIEIKNLGYEAKNLMVHFYFYNCDLKFIQKIPGGEQDGDEFSLFINRLSQNEFIYFNFQLENFIGSESWVEVRIYYEGGTYNDRYVFKRERT